MKRMPHSFAHVDCRDGDGGVRGGTFRLRDAESGVVGIGHAVCFDQARGASSVLRRRCCGNRPFGWSARGRRPSAGCAAAGRGKVVAHPAERGRVHGGRSVPSRLATIVEFFSAHLF